MILLETQDSSEILEKKNEGNLLKINNGILKILQEEKLDINKLLILYCMYDETISLLDTYDGFGSNKEVVVFQYQQLYIHGFIEDTDTNKMFQITKKGKELVERIRAAEDTEEDDNKEISKLAKQYVDIFPSIKLPSGKYARSALPDIEKKLKSFIKEYRSVFKKSYGFKLSYEDILTATRNYVSRYSRTGYLYMATSLYFIKKDERSALAEELIALKTGSSDNKAQTNFTVV